MGKRNFKPSLKEFHKDIKFSIAAVQERGTWGAGSRETLGNFRTTLSQGRSARLDTTVGKQRVIFMAISMARANKEIYTILNKFEHL